MLCSCKVPRANLNWLFRCANQQSNRSHRPLPFCGFLVRQILFPANKWNGKTRKDDVFRVIYQRKRLDVCIRAANKVVRIFIHSIRILLLFLWTSHKRDENKKNNNKENERYAFSVGLATAATQDTTQCISHPTKETTRAIRRAIVHRSFTLTYRLPSVPLHSTHIPKYVALCLRFEYMLVFILPKACSLRSELFISGKLHIVFGEQCVSEWVSVPPQLVVFYPNAIPRNSILLRRCYNVWLRYLFAWKIYHFPIICGSLSFARTSKTIND